MVCAPAFPRLTYRLFLCSRCETLYSAMASGYAPEHIKSVVPKSGEAVTLARSAGDRIFEGFGLCYGLAHRLFCSDHCKSRFLVSSMLFDIVPVGDLRVLAEEAVEDIRVWTVNSDTNALAMSKRLPMHLPIL